MAILHIDLAKAFDRGRHDVQFTILQNSDVRDVIVKGVKVVCRDCSSRVIINRKLSLRIFVVSAVRLGCPLVPLLFPLYLESFYLSVACPDFVHGFGLQSIDEKLLAYDDDFAVFWSDMRNVPDVFSLTREYCEASGTQLNWQKSCVYFMATGT